MGRFAQADSIIPLQTQGTQAWDRYAYVNNNPLRYTDPSGHFLLGTMAIGGIVGALGGVALIMAAQIVTPEKTFTAQDYAAAVLVGAAAGALIGSGFGLGAGTAMATTLSTTLTGAGTGAAGSAIGYTFAAGASFDSAEMAVAAGIGGVTGAVSGWSGQVTKQLANQLIVAQPVVANGAIQMGLPILGNQVQTLAFSVMDGGEPTMSDHILAPAAGSLGGAAGFFADGFLPSGVGGAIRPLIANSVASFFGNWWQGEAERVRKDKSKDVLIAY